MSQTTTQVGLPSDTATKTINYADTELTLQEAAADLVNAHDELDQYHTGALTLAAELEELQAVAETEGDADLARTAQQLKQSALAVTNRINR